MDEHPQYRITSQTTASGGFGELEEKTTFEVIDVQTGTAVLTFVGEYSAEYTGGPGWDNGVSSGVEKVEFASDGAAVNVYRRGAAAPERVPLPSGPRRT